MKPHRNLRVTASLAVSHPIFFLTAMAIALALYPTQTAQAIPNAQDFCRDNAADEEVAASFPFNCPLGDKCFTRLPELRIPATTSTSERRCILTFSAQYEFTQPEVGMVLAYSVDKGACRFREGPSLIVPTQPEQQDLTLFNGTTTLVSRIIFNDQKSHTIEPCIAEINPGTSPRLSGRCVIVECTTQ